MYWINKSYKNTITFFRPTNFSSSFEFFPRSNYVLVRIFVIFNIFYLGFFKNNIWIKLINHLYITGSRIFIEVIECIWSGCFRAMIFPNEGWKRKKTLIWSLVFILFFILEEAWFLLFLFFFLHIYGSQLGIKIF